MGTRSRIGILNDDKTVTSIYCHWDGYPENNGKILMEHYQDEAKIRSLIALGDLSILGHEIGEAHDFDDRDNAHGTVCIAYARDRGEKDVSSTSHTLEDWPDYGQEYVYLWRNGRWEYAESDYGESISGTWKVLTRKVVGLPPSTEPTADYNDETMFDIN